MNMKIIIALIALVMLIAPAIAIETHSETLSYDQIYVASDVGASFGSAFDGPFDFAWALNFDTMPMGESLLIAQMTIYNATASHASFPFTAYYNNTLIGGGTCVVSNGTFSGKTHQVEFYWDSFAVPSYGVTGKRDIILNTSVDTHSGEGKPVTTWYGYGGSLGASSAIPMQFGNYQAAYYFSSPVYLSVDYTLTKDDTGVYRFSLAKHGYQTKATIYSPDNVAAYTESAYNIVDRVDQVYINGGTARGGICSALAGGICLNTSWFFEPSYNMTIDQKTINQGGTTGIHITSSTGNYNLLNAYTLIITPDSGGGTATVGGENPTWILTGGHWKQWDDGANTYSIDWGTSFPSIVQLGNFTAPGTYTVEASLFQTDNYGPPTMSGVVNVTGAGVYDTITLRILDSSTGNLVYGSTGSILLGSGTWSNKTQSSTANTWSIADGSYIGYTASASGYEPMGITYTQITGDRTIDIPLTKTEAVTAGNTTLVVWVRTGVDGVWTSLSGAMVTCDGIAKTTGSSGVVTFEVLQSTTYSVSASKSGYNGVTRSVDVGTSQTSIALELSVLTVSPTTAQPTDSGGNPITTAPTLDTRTDAEKDQAMMDDVRYWAPHLIELFILVTILYLLGVKFG